MKPRSENSFSRRSVIATSVGHLSATSPSSVRKVCVGNPSTKPPPSTPRIAAHQLYLAKASVRRVPTAYAALPHRYLRWSVPSTSSTKLNASTGVVSGPYGNLIRICGKQSPTKRESSDSRNDLYLVYSSPSKILARSRGVPTSVKLSRLNNSDDAAPKNGACAAAATLESFSSIATSCGW